MYLDWDLFKTHNTMKNMFQDQADYYKSEVIRWGKHSKVVGIILAILIVLAYIL